jgi:hypothetical protein
MATVTTRTIRRGIAGVGTMEYEAKQILSMLTDLVLDPRFHFHVGGGHSTDGIPAFSITWWFDPKWTVLREVKWTQEPIVSKM